MTKIKQIFATKTKRSRKNIQINILNNFYLLFSISQPVPLSTFLFSQALAWTFLAPLMHQTVQLLLGTDIKQIATKTFDK